MTVLDADHSFPLHCLRYWHRVRSAKVPTLPTLPWSPRIPTDTSGSNTAIRPRASRPSKGAVVCFFLANVHMTGLYRETPWIASCTTLSTRSARGTSLAYFHLVASIGVSLEMRNYVPCRALSCSVFTISALSAHGTCEICTDDVCAKRCSDTGSASTWSRARLRPFRQLAVPVTACTGR